MSDTAVRVLIVDDQPPFREAAKVVFDNQFFFYPSIYYSLKGYKVTLKDPAFPPTELSALSSRLSGAGADVHERRSPRELRAESRELP